MSSSAQIVARAMRRLGLIDASEDPSAADSSHGLLALDAMIAGWEGDGINVSADVPLPAEHEEGVIAMLAVRLSEDYGKPVTPILQRDSIKGHQRLRAAYKSAPLARFDTALQQMPSVVISYVGAFTDWATSTAYVEFDRVAANRRFYECIVAGTSASTGDGPSSAGPSITDGTVTWRYLGETN